MWRVEGRGLLSVVVTFFFFLFFLFSFLARFEAWIFLVGGGGVGELIQIDVFHQLHVIEEYDLVSRHCCAILILTPICVGITIIFFFV